MLWLALVVGVVLLAGGTTGGFLVGQNIAGGATGGPVRCGGEWSGTLCIPGLAPDAVTTLLTDRGFSCEAISQAIDRRQCTMTIGSNQFVAAISAYNALVGDFDLTVYHHTLGALTPSGESYLTWFAVVPFGADPEADAAARQWLGDQLAAGAGGTATIRGYGYQLEYPEAGQVSLRIVGGFA